MSPRLPGLPTPSQAYFTYSTESEDHYHQHLTKSTTRLINQYINHQKRTGACGLCHVSTSQKRIWYHVRQRFCPSTQQNRSRGRLYSYLAQHNKQGNYLDAAVHMVDKGGYKEFTQRMEWSNPPPFSLPALNKTQPARSQPYHIPRQKPTTPTIPRMTRKHCITVKDSIKAYP